MTQANQSTTPSTSPAPQKPSFTAQLYLLNQVHSAKQTLLQHLQEDQHPSIILKSMQEWASAVENTAAVKSEVQEPSPSPKPTPTAQPSNDSGAIKNGCYYQVHEDATHKLDQLRGTLSVLCGLAGTASMKDKAESPECTHGDLSEMFWGMLESVQYVMGEMQKSTALFHNNQRIL